MAAHFQKRYANQIVGIFVLLTVAILIAAVAVGPNTRRWLTPAHELTVRLPPEGSLGLRKGADVLILGSVVGSVDEISVSDSGEMEAEVSVRGNFIRFVSVNSKAFIRKPLGIGDATIEIMRGQGPALPQSGSIQAYADKAPTEMLEETLEDIRTEAVPALRELRMGVSQYTQLATDLRAQQPGLSQAIAHFNQIAGQVETGKGVAGALINDPALAQAVRQSLPKIDALLDDLKSSADNLRTFSAALPKLQGPAQHTLDQLPGLLMQVDESFRQIQRLTEAMQRNWLISGGMDKSTAVSTINADQVGSGR